MISSAWVNGMTMSKMHTVYEKEIEKEYKIAANSKKIPILTWILSKQYVCVLISEIVFTLTFILFVMRPSMLKGKLKEIFIDVKSRWSWFGFFGYVVIATMVGYTWAWRILNGDVLTKHLFPGDIVPCWSFFHFTSILPKEIIGFVIEDVLFYPVGAAFSYAMYKLIGVDKLIGDFKNRIKISKIFILLYIAVILFIYSFVDFTSMVTVQCYFLIGMPLVIMFMNKINLKKTMIYILFVICTGWFLDFIGVTLFPMLAKITKLPIEHLSMWYYKIGDIHSQLLSGQSWAWFHGREPFSILITFLLCTSIFSIGVIKFLEDENG
jgi:hypothetical protein